MSAWSQAGFVVVAHRMAEGADTARFPDPRASQYRCVDCEQRAADSYWALSDGPPDAVCRDCLLDRIHGEFLELEFARRRDEHS